MSVREVTEPGLLLVNYTGQGFGDIIEQYVHVVGAGIRSAKGIPKLEGMWRK